MITLRATLRRPPLQPRERSLVRTVMLRLSPGLFALFASTACSVDVADDGGFGSGASSPMVSSGVDGASSGVDGASSGGDATTTTGRTEDSTGAAHGSSTDVLESGETGDAGDADDAGDAGDTGDTGGESTSSTTSDAPGDPLHPDLDVPEDGQACQTPGSLGECPAVHVCRFHTTEQGLCESCDVCGNLNAPCQTGTDCDILFACFAGRCTNICPLGTNYCGPVEDCLDVGHPTHGVCDPFA